MATSLSSSGWRMACTEILPVTGIIAGVAGVAHLAGNGDQAAPWGALLFSSAVVFVVFAVLDVIAGGWTRRADGSPTRRTYGWLGVVLGEDGRVSTSKTQIFLWTAGIAWALLFLSGLVMFRADHDASVFNGTQWDDYLVLLGGPFAAGVLAKFTVASQLNAGTAQKSVTAAATTSAAAAAGTAVPTTGAKATDVVTNDNGELDLVDTQYFVFNLVAFAYVFGTFISRIIDPNVTDPATKYSLPVVPSVILALTSASAATYVANKGAQKSGPRISAVNPPSPAAGQNADIFGVNLVPAGADPASVGDQTSILITDTATGGAQFILGPASTTTPSPTKVTVTIPVSLGGKQVQLRVVTVNGVATDPYLASVAAAT